MSEVFFLDLQMAVIAYDRVANCTRCVHGSEVQVVNASGDVVECRSVNTSEGYIKIDDPLNCVKMKRIKGEFQIVLTREAELKYNGSSSETPRRSGGI
jgi:hypothetical protein